MRSVSIGFEPIAAASITPNTQTVSDGSFAQSLQDTVDMGGTSYTQSQPTEQGGELQQVAQPQENLQAAQETQPQEAQEAQEVQQPQQPESAADGSAVRQTDEGGHFRFEVKWEDPDPELMKELEDLLDKTEDMLTAPQRMQETIKSMITQAYAELNDPEASEEEFTELVLEFLLKYIDEKFGGEGEREESSIVGDSEDDDYSSVHDVLMQVVVQMLESIRSEDVQPEVPEDEEPVDGVPSAEAVDETSAVTEIEPLTDVSELEHIPEEIVYETDEAYITEPQTENVQQERSEAPAEELPEVQETEKPVDESPEVLPENKTTEKVYSPEFYQAAMQTAENIYNAIVQEYQPQQPVEQPQQQPGSNDRTVERSTVFPMEPADELAELTRLVNGGESVKSEQPELNFGSRQETEELIPEVKLEATGETVPFEAAIASTVPQVTVARAVEGSGAERVVTQIVSEIFNQLPENGGTTTFVMTLNPESLGKVTVKLVEEAGKISVSVTAHNKQTAEVLSQRFDTLQTAMKENGVELEKYQVVYAPEKDEGAGQQNFDGSSKNPYVKQDDEEGEGGDEFAEFLQQAV